MAPAQQRKKRFRSVSLIWLLPNMLTVAGLVSGLTALRFALDGRWEGTIGLIVLAAVFDALDGRTARRLKTSSAFGAALDSLCDMVVFGVVPALCLYLWALQDSGNLAWWATMISTYWKGASRFAGAFPAAHTMKAWPSVADTPKPITQSIWFELSGV